MELTSLEQLLEINLVLLLRLIFGLSRVLIVLMLDGQNPVMDLIILKFGIKTNQLILRLDSEILRL